MHISYGNVEDIWATTKWIQINFENVTPEHYYHVDEKDISVWLAVSKLWFELFLLSKVARIFSQLWKMHFHTTTPAGVKVITVAGVNFMGRLW